ncbi:hypothetical protein [Alteromonas sp. C1M14]|uniref:hypothetical protein n=1 Tax=Alteromonas sp. C1M14 TaxID=2841567 RepID=UPI001C085246|nr:hypothetical protein [Alteromonas sp. C1M14]MBU2978967.1 hypothetical protein [Alteromonas sp. C1M14]
MTQANEPRLTQAPESRFPPRFDTTENISFNHRMLKLFLAEHYLKTVQGSVLEVNFPWQSGLFSYAETNAFTRYSDQAIDFISVLTTDISHNHCDVIFLEVDHNRCLYSVASTQPQQLFNALQQMQCPTIFAAPAVTPIDMTACQYVRQKRE